MLKTKNPTQYHLNGILVEVSGLEPLSKRRTRRLSTCLSCLWFSRMPCRKAGEASL